MMMRTKTKIVFLAMLFSLFLLAVSFAPIAPVSNIAYAGEDSLSGFGDDDQDLPDGSANEVEQEFFAGTDTLTGVVPLGGEVGGSAGTQGEAGGSSGIRGGGSTGPAGNTSYTPLAPLPGIGAGDDLSLPNYIDSLFRLGLGLAGVFAVLMLVVAGIQYVGSAGSDSAKSAAKQRITNVFFGLIIGMSVFLLFNTINPDLLKTDLSIETVTVQIIPQVGDDGSAERFFQETRVSGKWYFTQYSTNTRNTVTTTEGPYNSQESCENGRRSIQFPESYDTNSCVQAQTAPATATIPEQNITIPEKYYFYTWDSRNGNNKQDGPYETKESCETSRSKVQEPWRSIVCGLR